MKNRLAYRSIQVDRYTKIQSISSGNRFVTEEVKVARKLDEKHLAFIDFDKVFFEIERFKSERAW